MPKFSVIRTNSNKEILVDSDNYDCLNLFNWHITASGYAAFRHNVKGKKKTVYMHRIINKTPEGLFTDHINRNKLDNRRANLRSCDKSINALNSKRRINNKSGCTGVSWFPRDSKWRVRVKRNHIGYYRDLQEAIIVHRRELSKYV